MLGDLRGELAEVGQIRVLESVGDRALEYFDSLDDTDLTDEALLRKSRALYQIGDVYFELGEFQRAMTSFRSSLEQARRLAAAEPESDERLFELAQAEFWVGYAADAVGNLDLAERHLTAYRDAAHLLVERDPANDDWAMEAFWSSNNLGTLEMRRSQFEVAQAYFEDAIRRIDALIEREATPDRLLERATILSWLGSSHFRRGNLAAARDAYLAALDTPIETANALAAEERAYELGFISDVELELGNLQEARVYVDQAVEISKRLSDADPDNMDLLYARTAQELRAARLNLIEETDVPFASLRDAADALLAVEESPSLWKMAVLGIADVGVRVGDPGALPWVRSLLESEAVREATNGGLERRYIDLLISLAPHDAEISGKLTQLLPRVTNHYDETGDFELVLPLYRAYALIGDQGGTDRMGGVLENAGSRHPYIH